MSAQRSGIRYNGQDTGNAVLDFDSRPHVVLIDGIPAVRGLSMSWIGEDSSMEM